MSDFDQWCRQVWEPYLERRDKDWEKNDKQHEEILGRLDKLNGWRNKLLGIALACSVILPVLASLIASGHLRIVV